MMDIETVPLEDQEQVVARWRAWMSSALFTFSSKASNSNAWSTGVRPGAGRGNNLPHLSATTLIDRGEAPGIDYLGDARAAKLFKQLRILIGEIPATKGGTPTVDPQILQAYKEVCAAPGELGTQSVCKRLHQLKLPVAGGGYRVITPLTSAGLAQSVNDELRKRSALRELKEKDVIIRKETRVSAFSVGGSNPQNVGGRVRELHRPLVCDRLPSESPNLKHAFSLLYLGLRLRLGTEPVRAYALWWTGRKASLRDKSKPWTLKDKDQEKAFLRVMISGLLSQARSSRQLIEENWETIGEGELWTEDSQAFSLLDKGWMRSRNRSIEWKSKAASSVVVMLSRMVMARNSEGGAIFIDLDQADKARLVSALGEIL